MAGLISRQKTGKGVWIDCNLFETQVGLHDSPFSSILIQDQIAGLANIASNYLIAGQEASRHGTAHPSIVPYQVFPCRDGFLMIGAGNNKQVKDLRFYTKCRRLTKSGAYHSTFLFLIPFVNGSLGYWPREFWVIPNL